MGKYAKYVDCVIANTKQFKNNQTRSEDLNKYIKDGKSKVFKKKRKTSKNNNKNTHNRPH